MIEDLIRRARRRFVVNEALGQTAFAAAIAAGGLALLLIAGTRYLEWWTVAVFAAAGIGVGGWRVFRRFPATYATAIRLDQNAHLHDALSTAIHFSGPEITAGNQFQRAQREQAEAAARTVNLDVALPFTFPRALYAMAALSLLASGLVVLRYRTGRGLDLRAPITEVVFQDEALHSVKDTPKPRPQNAKKWYQEAESLFEKLGAEPVDADDPSDPEAFNKALEQALKTPQAGDPQAKDGAQGGDDQAAGQQNANSNGDPMEGDQQSKGEKADSRNSKEGKPGDQGNPGTGSSSDQNLLSKLKDAVSNMFSKSNSKEQKASNKGNQQQAQKSDKSSNQKSGSKQGKPEDSQSDTEEADANDPSQNGAQSQGNPGDKPSNAQNSTQPGSGAGSEEGDKVIKLAEQLKAMGKISEIIGKRAATISGDTTIEVESGSQQLRTGYSTSTAEHHETESDVSRDEIPVALQSYVQQYFEEVRKTAAKKPAPSSKSEATP